MSKHEVELYEIATTKPDTFIIMKVRYPTYRPRGYVLEVRAAERRDGVHIETFSVGRPDDPTEDRLADATRFNARTLDKLATAVRTLGTDENRLATRAFKAFIAKSGLVAPAHPFGED